MISHPPLIDAAAGDPIKSEDWNNVLAAIRLVYSHLNRVQSTLVVRVRNQADATTIRGAFVTVIEPGGGAGGAGGDPGGSGDDAVDGGEAAPGDGEGGPGGAIGGEGGPGGAEEEGVGQPAEGVVAGRPILRGPGSVLRRAVAGAGDAGGNARPGDGLEPAPGRARAAIYTAGSLDAYVVNDLPAGSYTVAVEAPGFHSTVRPVTVPDQQAPFELVVDLPVVEVRFPVPNIFGLPLSQALTTLTGQGFRAGRVIDAHGSNIPADAVPEEVRDAAVLGQLPVAGSLVPANTPFLLHISAKAEYLERVKVPDVRGMSIADARAALEAAGLVVGDTPTKKS
jgi:hypothetical protein